MIYLASRSPQRSMLLEQARVAFTVVESHGDEETVRLPHPHALALERARVKALGAQLPPGADGVILGADTVVSVGNEIFNKPADEADALRMLGRLAGTTHTVVTGHCCIRVTAAGHGTVACAIALAKVTMRPLAIDDLKAYVASGEWRDRAGGYAIQERGDRFIIDVQGEWSTVVGLSVPTVSRLYRELTDQALPMPPGSP